MSRILFICSGNTCRSPMTAAIAQRVFGSSHTVLSAGAETGSGFPVASNAVTAISEMGLDISNCKTIDVAEIELADLDLIVVFRPSAAESMSFPPGVPLGYLDIPDPYGGSIESYRITARLIERSIRRLYAEDACRRISTTATTSGSHGAGVFNRAAKEFEKEVTTFVARHLSLPVRDKATLGNLGERIRDYGASQDLPKLVELSESILEVNRSWVRVKHREDPSVEDLAAGLAAILRGFDLMSDSERPSNPPVGATDV